MSNQEDTAQTHKDDIPLTFYCISILFFIIGLPMFCMGNFKGTSNYNIAGYVKVHGTFKTPYSASFHYQNNSLSCRYLTEFDSSCMSEYTCRKYREYYYPIGSNADLLYLPSSGYCRTEKFTNNLAIAGIAFLGLCILSCAGMCISFRYCPNNDYIKLKTHETKYVILFDDHLEKNCSICCNEYTDQNKIIALKNCGHCFCESCIIDTLDKNNNCPKCRKPCTQSYIV